MHGRYASDPSLPGGPRTSPSQFSMTQRLPSGMPFRFNQFLGRFGTPQGITHAPRVPQPRPTPPAPATVQGIQQAAQQAQQQNALPPKLAALDDAVAKLKQRRRDNFAGFCPSCGSDETTHARAMTDTGKRANALCGACGHMFSDPDYGRKKTAALGGSGGVDLLRHGLAKMAQTSVPSLHPPQAQNSLAQTPLRAHRETPAPTSGVSMAGSGPYSVASPGMGQKSVPAAGRQLPLMGWMAAGDTMGAKIARLLGTRSATSPATKLAALGKTGVFEGAMGPPPPLPQQALPPVAHPQPAPPVPGTPPNVPPPPPAPGGMGAPPPQDPNAPPPPQDPNAPPQDPNAMAAGMPPGGGGPLPPPPPPPANPPSPPLRPLVQELAQAGQQAQADETVEQAAAAEEPLLHKGASVLPLMLGGGAAALAYGLARKPNLRSLLARLTGQETLPARAGRLLGRSQEQLAEGAAGLASDRLTQVGQLVRQPGQLALHRQAGQLVGRDTPVLAGTKATLAGLGGLAGGELLDKQAVAFSASGGVALTKEAVGAQSMRLARLFGDPNAERAQVKALARILAAGRREGLVDKGSLAEIGRARGLPATVRTGSNLLKRVDVADEMVGAAHAVPAFPYAHRPLAWRRAQPNYSEFSDPGKQYVNPLAAQAMERHPQRFALPREWYSPQYANVQAARESLAEKARMLAVRRHAEAGKQLDARVVTGRHRPDQVVPVASPDLGTATAGAPDDYYRGFGKRAPTSLERDFRRPYGHDGVVTSAQEGEGQWWTGYPDVASGYAGPGGYVLQGRGQHLQQYGPASPVAHPHTATDTRNMTPEAIGALPAYAGRNAGWQGLPHYERVFTQPFKDGQPLSPTAYSDAAYKVLPSGSGMQQVYRNPALKTAALATLGLGGLVGGLGGLALSPTGEKVEGMGRGFAKGVGTTGGVLAGGMLGQHLAQQPAAAQSDTAQLALLLGLPLAGGVAGHLLAGRLTRKKKPLGLGLDDKTASDASPPKAVIVKGNPDFVQHNPQARRFYRQLAAALRQYGYATSFDAGKPHTVPDETAALWVGHSRGADRLRFAPPTTRTLALGANLPGAVNHPDDDVTTPFHRVGGKPPDAHYVLTAAMRQALRPRDKTASDPFVQGFVALAEKQGWDAGQWGQALARVADAFPEALPALEKLAWNLRPVIQQGVQAGKRLLSGPGAQAAQNVERNVMRGATHLPTPMLPHMTPYQAPSALGQFVRPAAAAGKPLYQNLGNQAMDRGVGAMTGYFLGDELTDSTAGRWTGAALGAGVGARGLGMRSRFGRTVGKPFANAALGSTAGAALDWTADTFNGPASYDPAGNPLTAAGTPWKGSTRFRTLGTTLGAASGLGSNVRANWQDAGRNWLKSNAPVLHNAMRPGQLNQLAATMRQAPGWANALHQTGKGLELMGDATMAPFRMTGNAIARFTGKAAPFRVLGKGRPGWQRAAYNTGLAATAIPVAGLGYGILAGQANDFADRKIQEAGQHMQGMADDYLQQAGPHLAGMADQYLNQRGLLNEEGQFDPTQAVQHQVGGYVDQAIAHLGIDPRQLSGPQKAMLLGGGAASGVGALTGHPLLATLGGGLAAYGGTGGFQHAPTWLPRLGGVGMDRNELAHQRAYWQQGPYARRQAQGEEVPTGVGY